METSELLKKVRKIEIKTRGLSNNIFAGEYHSAFKGRGMAFAEVREYRYGDAIKDIDWNVTARFNKPFVKVFEEERELTLMLIVDISGSKNFGTQLRTKQELVAEVCAVLAFSAIQNNDKIGALLFSDQVELYIPPGKGRKHALRIVRELLEFQPKSRGTDVAAALQYFTGILKKKCTAFVVSDFICPDFKDAISIAARKHDVVALSVHDKRDAELPDLGLLKVKDAETGAEAWADTSSRRVREAYSAAWKQKQAKLEETFKKCGLRHAFLETGLDYVPPMMKMFAKG
jgi:uncharacterized protein (DUF58 family)